MLICVPSHGDKFPVWLEGRLKATIISVIWAVLVMTTGCTSTKPKAITQDELVRNTQELNDSLVVGNQAPWIKYFADDAMYMDEKGRGMDKAALVKSIEPLPKRLLRQHQGGESEESYRKRHRDPQLRSRRDRNDFWPEHDGALSRNRYLDVSERKMADRRRSDAAVLRGSRALEKSTPRNIRPMQGSTNSRRE